MPVPAFLEERPIQWVGANRKRPPPGVIVLNPRAMRQEASVAGRSFGGHARFLYGNWQVRHVRALADLLCVFAHSGCQVGWVRLAIWRFSMWESAQVAIAPCWQPDWSKSSQSHRQVAKRAGGELIDHFWQPVPKGPAWAAIPWLCRAQCNASLGCRG